MKNETFSLFRIFFFMAATVISIVATFGAGYGAYAVYSENTGVGATVGFIFMTALTVFFVVFTVWIVNQYFVITAHEKRAAESRKSLDEYTERWGNPYCEV